jgi:hypothetical protein
MVELPTLSTASVKSGRHGCATIILLGASSRHWEEWSGNYRCSSPGQREEAIQSSVMTSGLDDFPPGFAQAPMSWATTSATDRKPLLFGLGGRHVRAHDPILEERRHPTQKEEPFLPRQHNKSGTNYASSYSER